MIGAARYFNPRYWARRYWPKLGADPSPGVITPTGAISAAGGENYIGGGATISALAGSVDMGTLGGSISGSVFGGSIS
jgi:hypothetical protein